KQAFAGRVECHGRTRDRSASQGMCLEVSPPPPCSCRARLRSGLLEPRLTDRRSSVAHPRAVADFQEPDTFEQDFRPPRALRESLESPVRQNLRPKLCPARLHLMLGKAYVGPPHPVPDAPTSEPAGAGQVELKPLGPQWQMALSRQKVSCRVGVL